MTYVICFHCVFHSHRLQVLTYEVHLGLDFPVRELLEVFFVLDFLEEGICLILLRVLELEVLYKGMGILVEDIGVVGIAVFEDQLLNVGLVQNAGE